MTIFVTAFFAKLAIYTIEKLSFLQKEIIGIEALIIAIK
ncbi:hypothetical protein CUZ96_0697 [Enterococcus lactis]|nr:hypothetical protein [Enterococcus lactis]MBL5011034.1 hypothetical protein [Enterococcus lactis]